MNTKNSGQIALIVLVVSAIVLTIGMSVSKKTVVETKITTDEELLKQAFNAAESGIDYYMGTGVTQYTAPDSLSKANITIQDIGGGGKTESLGVVTLKNTEDFTWLVGHNGDGSIDYTQKFLGTGITMCVASSFDGGLKVDYFYRDASNNYAVERFGFNVGTANRVTGFNNVTTGTCPGNSGMKGVPLSLVLNPATITPLLLVVKPIAADTLFTMVGVGGSFPNQAIEISSTGKAGNLSVAGGVQVNQKVKVVNQFQASPFMLDAVTATGNIFSN